MELLPMVSRDGTRRAHEALPALKEGATGERAHDGTQR
jgi:hypothetical protein